MDYLCKNIFFEKKGELNDLNIKTHANIDNIYNYTYLKQVLVHLSKTNIKPNPKLEP